MIDNVAAARDGVEMLLRQGRERIAFLGMVRRDPTESTYLRLLGYQEALLTAHAYADPRLVVETDWFSVDDGVSALQTALESGARFDAVFCRDDLFAMAALRVLERAGMRVPADVAVLGWDDTALARYSTPALSSISPDKEAIARTALDLLEDRMGGFDGVGRHRIVSHTIVQRGTTGISA
jgi:DNA-binding LacI/PurR family transcriptional regulator